MDTGKLLTLVSRRKALRKCSSKLEIGEGKRVTDLPSSSKARVIIISRTSGHSAASCVNYFPVGKLSGTTTKPGTLPIRIIAVAQMTFSKTETT